MFSEVKMWRNKSKGINNRTWTRRIRWLEDNEHVKLKLEDGEVYREVLTDRIAAQTIWTRFKEGQSIDDAVSILGNVVPKSLRSKKGT